MSRRQALNRNTLQGGDSGKTRHVKGSDEEKQTNVNTFKLDAKYFYLERKTGRRFEFDEKLIETELFFETVDVQAGMTIQKKGRGFLLTRTAKDRLDAWLAGPDMKNRGLKHAGDAIIVQDFAGDESHYRIDGRDPVATIGTNEALFRFNTFLETKNEHAPQSNR